MGGSRFGVISEKYRTSEENSEEDDDELGEGRRLGEGSSLNGSPSASTGAAAVRRQGDRGSGSVAIKALAGPDDDDDPPPYEGAHRIETIHNSIEGEGVKSINIVSNWNFDGLGGSGAEDSTIADAPSDEVQLDSSSDERGLSQFDDQDTSMTGHDLADEQLEPLVTDEGHRGSLADIQNAAGGCKGVIAVPAGAGSDGDSNEVAEIHLESEKGTRTG